MNVNLTDPVFNDEDKAREYFEGIRWPNGPYCPHCGNSDPERIVKLTSEAQRAGLYQCRECRKQFTVTVGHVMERSHVPLAKWALAFHLMASSKKGMSAHQLMRMLGLGSYRTAWFMAHRIREAMRPAKPDPIGGENKVVEADETFVGGKAKNRAYAKKPPKKETVLALVERDGEVRSYHIANVTAKTLRPIIVQIASRKSYLMTDEALHYVRMGAEFAGHGSVNHSANEYARGTFWHTNTVENYFSILKRGIYGVYHHVSEAHLKRYLAEFDFRYSKRMGLGFSDTDRAVLAIKGAEGKRLMYRQPRESANA